MPARDDRLNILLVDDPSGNLMTCETILAPLGENLVKARSGDEALQHLLNTEFAVVLVDACTPHLDGFELASMIRQHPRGQHTAIIFISAVPMTDMDKLKGYELGAVDYVSVPVAPELLRARVAIFADLYRRTAALERMNRVLEERVAERTAKLEEDLAQRERLEQALRAADRRKDEFIATLAHELRNPLAAICGAAQWIQAGRRTHAELAISHDVILRQTLTLVRLVDDLLDMSRISRGQISLRRERVERATAGRDAADAGRPVFRLPAGDVASAPEAAPPGPPARTVRRRRVLVVDDNRDAARMLSLVLGAMGHETRIAYDGVAALREAEAFQPDVALLDIGMPKLDGYGVARELRAKGANQSILLIALTGWGQDEDRQRSTAAGFDLHLVKPVDSATLRRVLDA